MGDLGVLNCVHFLFILGGSAYISSICWHLKWETLLKPNYCLMLLQDLIILFSSDN